MILPLKHDLLDNIVWMTYSYLLYGVFWLKLLKWLTWLNNDDDDDDIVDDIVEEEEEEDLLDSIVWMMMIARTMMAVM